MFSSFRSAALILLAVVLALTGTAHAQTLSFTNRTTTSGLGNNIVRDVYASGGGVYAATQGGLSISTDGGATFSNRTTADGLGNNTVNGVYAVGSTVYAATASGVSISTDGGTLFTNRTTSSGLGNNNVRDVYASGGVVYAATQGGLSISTDGGATFSNRTTADGLGNNSLYRVYVVGSTVYAATASGLSISTDGGTLFTNRTTTSGLGNNDVRDVHASGGVVYAATQGGLSISTDGGATFSNRTTADGLGSSTLYGVHADGSAVYAATSGGLSISTDGGQTFTNYASVDGLGSDIVLNASVSGSTVYAATTGGLSIGLLGTPGSVACPNDPNAATITNGTDVDGDDYCSVASGGTDCEDSYAYINPGAVEECDSYSPARDEDCDGYAEDLDPDGASGKVTYYTDVDGDGYGVTASVVGQFCDDAAGRSSFGGDCDDTGGVFDDQSVFDAFATSNGDSIATQSFAALIGMHPSPLNGTFTDAPGYSWTATATGGLLACNGALSILSINTQPLTFTFNQGVRGVAGRFYATDFNCVARPTSLTVTLSDGSTLVGPVNDDSVFTGIYSTGALITSITIAVDSGKYPTVDFLSVVVPAPGSVGPLDLPGFAINPGATEVCDGVDNDCANGIDDGQSNVDYYVDGDNDGYGNAYAGPACSEAAARVRYGAGDYSTLSGDCGDAYADVYPGAAETCANLGVNNDCDGDNDAAEASDSTTYYDDDDGDTYGDPADSLAACSPPTGYVTNDDDCDDANGDMYPGNPEVCDGYDNDCANGIDDGQSNVDYYTDGDDDGYGNAYAGPACSEAAARVRYGAGDYSTLSGDCGDAYADVYPGAAETCANLGVNNDCDGDNDAAEASDSTTYYDDDDGDTYGDPAGSLAACSPPTGYVTNDDDCDDTVAAAWTGRAEICDGYDNDCASGIDDGQSNVDYYTDGDDDGYGDAYAGVACSEAAARVRYGAGDYSTLSGDCGDAYADVYPGAAETCANLGVNNDCDGDNDAAEASDSTTYYDDDDGDTYGDPADSLAACSPPTGYVTNDDDCDDANGDMYPGNPEVCDGYDNDCANGIDDGQSNVDYYTDGDDDGYGNAYAGPACSEAGARVRYGAGDYSTLSGDCGDAYADVYPGAIETCANDGIDNDCDGAADDDSEASDATPYYADADGDGIAVSTPTLFCTPPYVDGTSHTRSGTTSYSSGSWRIGFATSAISRWDDIRITHGTTIINESFNGGQWNAEYFEVVSPSGSAANGYYASDTVSGVNTRGVLRTKADYQGSASQPLTVTATLVYSSTAVDIAFMAIRSTGLYSSSGGEPSSSVYLRMHNFVNGQVNLRGGWDIVPQAKYGNAFMNGRPLRVTMTDDGTTVSYTITRLLESHYTSTAPLSGDCDDSNADIYPGATETCANLAVDNDCDGYTDIAEASDAITYYYDGDGDNYGDPGDSVIACSSPTGYVTNDGDCDDSNDARFSGNPEICDGYDNDCANGIDDGQLNVDYYTDGDDDGYGAGPTVGSFCSEYALRVILETEDDYSTFDSDCQDGDAYIYPGALETCANVGIDNDCSQGGVGTDKTAVDMRRYYSDGDGDGYGTGAGILACSAPFGYVAASGDCNDEAYGVNPGATEICDGVNNDCDSYTDEGFTDTDSDGYADCVDPDIDGDGSLNADDCDDYAADVYPGALENCANLAVDNDCDGIYSADEAVDSTDYFTDLDGDGYGTGSAFKACSDTATTAPVDGDCDDSVATGSLVNPGAAEICDGYDNNCAGGIDEDFPDFDEDGYADCVDGDIDGDGYANGLPTDCDDYNTSVYQGAAETCANYGVDNDCDGDRYDTVGVNWYRDVDGDDYGDPNDDVVGCAETVPAGYVDNYSDCDDNYSYAWTLTSDEICDGYDNNCSGVNDEGVTTRYFLDNDGDTYGDPDVYVDGCSAPDDHVDNYGDCNDDPAADGAYAWTGRAEVCDEIDNDCNGQIDEGVQTQFFRDADGDGFTDGYDTYACSLPAAPAGGGPWKLVNDGDCDDTYGSGASIYPGAPETCADYGINNDCDAYSDDVDTNAADKTTYWRDADGDQYTTAETGLFCPNAAGVHQVPPTGWRGAQSTPVDCDDDNAARAPNLPEVCDAYRLDEDCDGYADDLDPNGAIGKDIYYPDADGDGFGDRDEAASRFCHQAANWSTSNDDCRDAVVTTVSVNGQMVDVYGADVYPGAAELCSNINIDNDCDGNTTEADDLSAWAYDADLDGYGTTDPAQRIKACTAPNGYVADTTDCNDSDAYVNPGMAEVCDLVDNNCSGTNNEGLTFSDWYADGDGDGFGNQAGDGYNWCAALPGLPTTNNTDCNDGRGDIYPGAAEVCDTVDNDCDNLIDDADGDVTGQTRYYPDADGDSFGDRNSGGTLHCFPGEDRVTDNTDCDDTYGSGAEVYPGAAEAVGNDRDDDCDGYELCYWDRDDDGFLDGYGGTVASSNLSCSDAFESAVNSPTGDCNDADATVYPGAPENCDTINVDNDCDGNATEAENALKYYRDADDDGYGSGTVFQIACSQPDGWGLTNLDCDDAYADINPGAPELCATVGVDNDCDGYADDVDADAADKVDLYADADGDTWTTATTARFCPGTTNAGWLPTLSSPVDCNDASADIYPGAPELCSTGGVDNDCDTFRLDVDEYASDKVDFYADADGDTWTGATTAKFCPGPDRTGWRAVAKPLDCNDQDAAINPGATELIADGYDNDCDGYELCYWDRDDDGYLDGDGYTIASSNLSCADAFESPTNSPTGDCDDLNPAAYPFAPELCATIGVDNDCDGNVNDATDFAALWVDYDGDGFGDRSTSAVKSCAGQNMVDNNGDCDDDNAAINPDAVEVCDGGVDNDCDGLADDDAGSGVTDPSTWFEDADNDGAGDPAVSAMACERPTGFVDNDDDGCPTVTSLQAPATWYRDQDIDGYGDPATTTTSCDPVAGYVSNALDQCPLHMGQFPSTWYFDFDGDGYGDVDSYASSCGQPTGYVANSSDGCPDVYELQAPVTYYVDGDGDGYGSTVTEEICATTAPDGYADNSGDCYDGNASLVTPIRYYDDEDGDGYGDPDVYTDECSLTAPDGYVANSLDECPIDGDKSESGQCGCDNADTDSDGDGVADCVDTTPWLYLEAAAGTFTDGDVTVNVELGARLDSQSTVGAQLAMVYDTSKLAFVSIEPGSSAAGDGLLSQTVFLNHTAADGSILYGVGVGDTYGGDTFATTVAVMRFRVADGVSSICGESNLVRFAPVGNAVTRLSGTAGVPISPTTSDLGPISADGGGSGFIGVPSAWSRPADAGLAGSLFVQPDVTFVIPCTSPPAGVGVDVEHDLPGGGTAWASGWPEGNLFQVGVTTVRWLAFGEIVERTFTVENHQVMELSVALEGSVADNSRTLSIVTGLGSNTVVRSATDSLSGTASTVSVQLPVRESGAYDCVSVKDAAHTLRSSATVSVVGTVYTAALVLEQGDSNDDNTVDILDFGMYVADFSGSVASNARSNFNGDTLVSTTDFAFISANFFQVGSAGCTGAGSGGLAGDGPMNRVSVAQLRKMGMGELAAADLNRDGWLDTADMALWMQGARPEADAGDASSGGNAAE